MTMTNDYLRETVLSATPAQLLTMLYDRLLLDLARAEAAQLGGDWGDAGVHLLHAQDIIAELSSSLEVESWAGGANLLALYGYLATTLRTANITHDLALTRESATLLEPLRAAWHEAATVAAVEPGDEGHGIAVVA